MKQVILLICLLFNWLLFSQSNFNSESYPVTLGDLETNTFENDSTANALVIYEEGNSYVDQNEYDLRTEEKHKIKILKREGFEKAIVTIYLYNNEDRTEKVKDILATTYNIIDNNVVKTQLDEKNIFTEKYNDNYTLVKFTLPNVKEGSVITYSYKIISPFMFKYKEWDFQNDIPKLNSHYITSIPANWQYNIKLVGYKPLDINTADIKKNCLEGLRGGAADCSINHYAMKDIPAFKEEDYMTAESNYLARIEYELKTFQGFDGTIHHYTKTWESVDNELRKEPNIGKQLGKFLKPEDFLDSKIINEKNPLKKAQSIYKYVQENYIWNDKYEIFKDVSVKDLIKEKSGNVSSINIFLHNLLEESGIEVKPILLSTRNNGFPTKIYPVISEFNYLIVQAIIDKKTYFLDATDKYLSFGEIPFRCLNGTGRVLDFEKGSDWINIFPDRLSTKQFKVELNLNNTDSIIGKLTSKNTGYHALNAKKTYYSNKETYINNLQNNYTNIEISDYNLLPDVENNSEFVESYNVKFENNFIGENIYLNPFLVKFFKENPFKLQQRTYPTDFGYKDAYFYIFNLNIGDTYSFLEKPKDVFLRLPNNTGQLNFSSTIIGNTINLVFKIEFKEAIYPAEYYPYLKEFMNKIVDIQNNSLIVLKKK